MPRPEVGAALAVQVLLKFAQWTVQVSKIACADGLDTRVVFTVEWSDRTWAACVAGINGRVKPYSDVIGMDGAGGRVHVGIRERCVFEYHWSRTRAGRYDECLHAKAPDEVGNARASAVCFEVSLIPRKTKRRARQLDDKDIEISVGRQAERLNMHFLGNAEGIDGYTSSRVWQTVC